jgi:hypothetical protein
MHPTVESYLNYDREQRAVAEWLRAPTNEVRPELEALVVKAVQRKYPKVVKLVGRHFYESSGALHVEAMCDYDGQRRELFPDIANSARIIFNHIGDMRNVKIELGDECEDCDLEPAPANKAPVVAKIAKHRRWPFSWLRRFAQWWDRRGPAL